MRRLIVIGALACAFPLGHAGARPAFLHELRHAHPDLRHGGGEPHLVLGYGGMVSFGHAAFFGAGACIVGIRRRKA